MVLCSGGVGSSRLQPLNRSTEYALYCLPPTAWRWSDRADATRYLALVHRPERCANRIVDRMVSGERYLPGVFTPSALSARLGGEA